MYSRVSVYQHNIPQHHRRPSVNTSKKTVVIVKPPRLSLSKTSSSGRLHRTAIAKPKPSATKSLEEDLDADAMPNTFHQFCTFCEKQIPTPNGTILYCSESCRRRDSSSSTPPNSAVSSVHAVSLHDSSNASNASTSSGIPGASPVSPLTEYEAFIGRPLLSRRKPSSAITAIAPAVFVDLDQSSSSSLSFPSSVPAVLHNGKADMDPTEWKPDPATRSTSGSMSGTINGSSATHTCTRTNKSAAMTEPDSATSDSAIRAQSAAYLYLSQFHRSAVNFAALSSYGSGHGSTCIKSVENNIIPTRRHRGDRSVNSLFEVASNVDTNSSSSSSDSDSNSTADSNSADSSIASSPISATADSPMMTTEDSTSSTTTVVTSGTPSIFVDEGDGRRICLAEGKPIIELVQNNHTYAKEPVKSVAEISIVAAEVGGLGKLLNRAAAVSDADGAKKRSPRSIRFA